MLNNLTVKKNIRTFSVCPENPSGKKGEGGKATLDVGSAANAARELGQGWKVNPYIVLNAGEIAVLADIKGEGAIKHFWITDSAKYGRQLLLRIYFDGQKSPAVDVPLSDFFANADYNEYRQINSLAMCYNPRKGMNCYFEMPYFKGFRVEIENTGTTHANITIKLIVKKKRYLLTVCIFMPSSGASIHCPIKKYIRYSTTLKETVFMLEPICIGVSNPMAGGEKARSNSILTAIPNSPAFAERAQRIIFAEHIILM